MREFSHDQLQNMQNKYLSHLPSITSFKKTHTVEKISCFNEIHLIPSKKISPKVYISKGQKGKIQDSSGS